MNQPDLLKNTDIRTVKLYQASGTSAVNSDSVDMQGWEGVMFVTEMGTANAGNYVNAAQSSDNSTFNDLEGTRVTPSTDGDQILVDIYRPRARYVRLEAVRAGSATTLETIIAIRYGPRKAPHTSHSSQETHVSPAEGTA